MFHRARTFNDKPLSIHKIIYYIDLNGANMSCVESIQTEMDADADKSTNTNIV